LEKQDVMNTPTLCKWLVHVLKETNTALSIEEPLHSIMDSIKQHFPCQSVAVLLIDNNTKELRIKIARQISYTFAKEYHRNGPSPTAERAILEQRALLLNNLDPRSETYNDIKLEHDFTSAVLAPIVTDQRGIGYIFCDRGNGETFSEDDLLHLEVVGYLIGNLITKIELTKVTRHLSQIDEDSGALHHKAFVPAFSTELERAGIHNYPVTLSLMTVDAFRKYVDTYGIVQAHALLTEVVAIIRKHIRDMDILARFGADEFILCFSGMTGAETKAKLKEIHEDVARNAVGQGGATINLTIGTIALEDPCAMKRRLQDIFTDLGTSLADAKGHNRLEAKDLP